MALDKVVTAKSTQTAFDLALQLRGSVDDVFELLEANPAIENLETDVTGAEVAYQITGNAVQKYYINQSVSVSSKPARYRNSSGPKLLVGTGVYLHINNSYNLLI